MQEIELGLFGGGEDGELNGIGSGGVTVFIQIDAHAQIDAHPHSFIVRLLAQKIGEIDDFINKNACI